MVDLLYLSICETHTEKAVFCNTEVSSSQNTVLAAHMKYLSKDFIWIV